MLLQVCIFSSHPLLSIGLMILLVFEVGHQALGCQAIFAGNIEQPANSAAFAPVQPVDGEVADNQAELDDYADRQQFNQPRVLPESQIGGAAIVHNHYDASPAST